MIWSRLKIFLVIVRSVHLQGMTNIGLSSAIRIYLFLTIDVVLLKLMTEPETIPVSVLTKTS